ncbi:MAG: hypothetical protein IPJ88_12030 [Myxococcales bacterium]|nr:MAG: hypothetical protein IPJ88_12030 [Myxococcales bacterium]
MLGLSYGCALGFRPVESTALLWPLLAHVIYSRFRDYKQLGVFACSVFVPVFVWACYYNQVTGAWWLPSRYGANQLPNIPSPHSRGVTAALESTGIFWHRFGANLSYNLLMIAIYLLTPLGMVLVGLGALCNRTTKLLSLGVLTAFGSTMLHDDSGIHAVGPIHFSEAALLLLLIALFGLRSFVGFVSQRRWPVFAVLSATIGSIVIAGAVFGAWQGRALRKQAGVHAQVYGYFSQPMFANAVVMVPPYYEVKDKTALGKHYGGFVFEWRKLSPARNERTVFVHDEPDILPLLKRIFRNEKLFAVL